MKYLVVLAQWRKASMKSELEIYSYYFNGMDQNTELGVKKGKVGNWLQMITGIEKNESSLVSRGNGAGPADDSNWKYIINRKGEKYPTGVQF